MEYKQLLAKCMDLCSRREYCQSDIDQKLRIWEVPQATIAKILKVLSEEKFIDHTRFVRAFVNDKLLFNHWGRIKIRYHLVHHRIEKEIIEEGLDNIDEEKYLQIIKDEIVKKRKATPRGIEFERNQKIARTVISKGFEPELVFKLLKSEQENKN